ncbi:MAG TPA: c-type cytochrome, partial [Candidatus Tectomicrobia bacterium]|nr:c-type cytochrome [Candidatus Tectomicrobia bacterium]
AMTPHPPHLPRVVAEWEPEELFYIVKHGVKFTAMPAWPTMNRDDEVWAMVAFLRALPGLDAAAYARLVGGEDGLGDTGGVVARCSRCHGEDGNGRGLGAFPKLAGQRPDYLLASIEAFARGERHSGIMMPVAAALDADDVREVVRHYADLPRSASPPARADDARVDEARVDDALRAIGEGIAQRGIPAQRVPACAACHGPGDTPRNPIYPELANQYAGYLALQLRLFKDDRRGGTPYAHIMGMVASRLTTDQMRAVAAYYASLPPARRTGRDRR